ncbi:Sentrin-specific protease, partial [Bienertia sinuspersici]
MRKSKKNLGEEDGKNVTEDVGNSKMQPVLFHKEEEIPDKDSRKGKAESSEAIDTYNDLPVRNCDIIVSRTLQQQRNKYLDELSYQERVLEYIDVSRLSIDEDNPIVIDENEELRHTLESLVLLEIINPANLDIHTWFIGASIDACSYIFNRREEETPGNSKRFRFNLLPFLKLHQLLIDERKKKERIDSIITEREIDLEKAKDNPHYDTMKAEWLKHKQKMTYRDSSFFADKCRQSMNSWEKMFPNNSIRHTDLIFVPTHLGNHFIVLVFNVQKSMIEDIDNHSVNKSFARYGEKPYDRVYELCRVLQSFLQGNRIKSHGFDGLHHWKRMTIPFSWRSNQIDFDCGIYSVKAMEWYDGGNEKKDPITTLSTKKRKDKEKHLANLRAKTVEKVFLEDEKIREERARHEQE